MNLFFRVIIDLLLITSKKSTSISQSQSQYLFLQHRHESNSNLLNPNKVGLFEGSFFFVEGGGGRGVSLTPLSYFKKNVSNNNITVYNC